MIRARAYIDADLPVLQDALAGWIHEAGPCGYCHVGDIPHRIYETLRGRRALGDFVHVWEDGRTIVGFAITTKFDRAFDVFVSPARRGTDSEVEMLESAFASTLRYVDGLALDDRSVITDVFGCDEARHELLSRLGFARYRLWDYVVARDFAQPGPDSAAPDGFTVRTASIDAARRIENVVVAPDGEIAAFAHVWIDARNRVGLFEPVGTEAEFRRRGLARLAMTNGLHVMRSLGMERAIVEYDAENTAAHELYGGLGFRRTFEVFGYRRDPDVTRPGVARGTTGSGRGESQSR